MHLTSQPARPAPFYSLASLCAALLAALLLTAGLTACSDTARAQDNDASERHDGHDHANEDHADEDHAHGAEEHAGHAEEDHAEEDHDEGGGHEAHDHGEEGHSEEGHDHDHAGHDHEDEHEEGPIQLTPEQRKEFGIEVAPVETGTVSESFTLPAEIHYNGDRLAHVVPRVAGIVTEVHATEGDVVEEGALLAVLDSRELADAKADYLAALEREHLQETKYAREDQLWQKKITSERTFLDAKSALAEARIQRRAAQQKLYALGLSESQLDHIKNEKEGVLTAYRLTAPFDGHVVKRHITLGESIDADQQAFILADLSTLWIDLSVFPNDLDRIEKGQRVEILDDDGDVIAEETVAFVTPQIEEGTRTAIARIVADPSGGRLRPGMFLTAHIKADSREEGLRVPKSAVQTVEGGPAVFVETDDGFEHRPVTLGDEGDEYVAVVSGLEPGETIATKGAFTLKAEVSKASFGGHHHH